MEAERKDGFGCFGGWWRVGSLEGEIGEQEVDECGWMLMGFDGWLKLVWVGLMDVVDGGKLGHWKEVVR